MFEALKAKNALHISPVAGAGDDDDDDISCGNKNKERNKWVVERRVILHCIRTNEPCMTVLKYGHPLEGALVVYLVRRY